MRKIIYRTLKFVVSLMMNDQFHYYLNPKWIMPVMFMQYLSLLFPNDQFANQKYNHLLLDFIKDLLTWSTLQKGIYLVNSDQFTHLCFHGLGAIHPAILLGICLRINLLKGLIQAYFSYLQICLFIPTVLLTRQYYTQMNPEDYGFILLYIIPLYFNYLIFSYISRNYALPTNNPYYKRYSITNIFETGIDIIMSICLILLSEQQYNIIIFIQAILLYVYAFIIQPYETYNNKRYQIFVVVYLVGSIIKSISFTQLNQDQIVYYILIFTPLSVRCNQSIWEFIATTQDNQSDISLEQILLCGDAISSSNVLRIEEYFRYLIIVKKLNVSMNVVVKNPQESIKYLLIQLLGQLRQVDRSTTVKQSTSVKSNLTLLEHTYFYYIYYLTFYCEQGLIAYITLKQYQQAIPKQSVYSLIFSEIIIKTIIAKTKRQQRNTQHDQFTINSIFQSYKFSEVSLKAVQCVMSAKLSFYKKLQHGFTMIEDVQSSACILSQPIIAVEQLIKETFHEHPSNILNAVHNFNLLTLKCLSLMYSIVFNDYFTCLELHLRIETMVKYELGLKTDRILNKTILDNDLVLIQLSIMKNPGKIMNTNRQQLAVFFGYQDQLDFDQIVTVEQLMPPYVALKHKQLIQNYIQRGSSLLLTTGAQVFYLDKYHFLHSAILQLSNIFDNSEDYIMTGMLWKQRNTYNYIIFDELGYILGTTEEIYTLLTNQIELHITYLQSKWLIYFWFSQLWDMLVGNNFQIPAQNNQTCFVNPLKNFEYVIRYLNRDKDTLAESCVTYNRTLDTNADDETNTRRQFNKIAKLDKDTIHQIQYELTKTLHDGAVIYVLKIISINQQQEESSLQQLDQINISSESRIKEFNVNDSPDNHLEGQQRLSQVYLPIHTVLETKRSNQEIPLIQIQQDQQKEEKSVKKVKIQKLSIADKRQQLMTSIASSTSSSQQNSIFNIIRNLSNNDATLSQVVKCVIIMSSLALIILALVVGELVLMRVNTNELQYQIPLVRIPNRFNRYYYTFTAIGQIDITWKVNNLTYGDYYHYRSIEEVQIMRSEILLLIRDLKMEFSLFDDDRTLKDLSIRIINEFSFESKNTSFIQFNQMVNDHSSLLSDYMLQYDQKGLFSNNDLVQQSLQLEFFKANLSVQMIITTQLITRIVEEFFNNIKNFQLQYMSLLITKLLIIVLLILIQYRLWLAPLVYQREILLIICKSIEEVIQDIIMKELTLQDQIYQKADRWKSIDYFTQVILNQQQIETYHQQQVNNGSNLKLSQIRIQRNFKTRPVKLFLAFVLWLMTMKVSMTYIYQDSISEQSQPELNLCMNFVKFTDSLNGLMVLSSLLKSQVILVPQQIESKYFSRNSHMNTSTQYFAILKQELLERYKEKYDSIVEGYPTIYKNIVSSNKMSDYNKQLLLSLYEQDMCNVLGDQLPFCEYSNGSFAQFPQYPIPNEIDNNRDILLYGMNGIVQRVMTILKSSYSKELNQESATNISDIYDFLQSKEYIEALLPFFFDLNKSFILFYTAIIQTSLDILESDYISIVIFQTCFEIGTLIVLFLFTYWRVRLYKMSIIAVRHCLVLIPQEKLRNPQIISRIKRINTMG